jgi:hypothetical protein
MKLLSDQQYFTPLLTLCMPFWQVLLLLHMNFRYSNIVDIPRMRTSTYGKNSFKYAAAVLWNDLPDDFRKNSNFNQFKNILKSWNGNVCKCSVCADF